MKTTKLLLVDDHKMVREGLKSVLEKENFHIVAQANNGAEALNILRVSSVDVVLSDINMPKMDGVELMKNIKKEFPDQKVIALTMLGESQHIKQMLKAGASGYLLKNSSVKEIKKAIEEVINNQIYYSPEVTQIIMDNLTGKKQSKMAMEVPLSSREMEVLHLIVKEQTNQEIADKLFISSRTVDAHKRNLLEKTGSKNVAGLVIYAMEKRLFDDV